MKILDSLWFTSFSYLGCLGIVIAENEEGERKAYVGMGFGLNQEEDERRIAREGSKLPLESVQLILRLLGEGKDHVE
jgi:hypothetical protein